MGRYEKRPAGENKLNSIATQHIIKVALKGFADSRVMRKWQHGARHTKICITNLFFMPRNSRFGGGGRLIHADFYSLLGGNIFRSET